MEKKSIFGVKNLKINKSAKNKLLLLALAGQLLVLSGCGKDATVDISHNSTITDTLDTVSDLTTMDEFLAGAKFTSKTNGEESSFEELIAYYNESRKNENLYDCNDALYKIGVMILKAATAEQLGITHDDIVEFSFDGSEHNTSGRCVTISYKTHDVENVPGGISVSHEEVKTKTFYLAGEIDALAINTSRAGLHALVFNNDDWRELDVDSVYESYVEFMLTSSTIEEKNTSWFNKNKEYVINSQLDNEKIDAFQLKKSK